MADENINDVLGIEETPQKEQESTEATEINNSAENTLTVIGNIVLVVGLFVGLICLFNICWVDKGVYITNYEFNPIGFATTVGIILSSVLTWAVLKVIANISTTLKEINAKIK